MEFTVLGIDPSLAGCSAVIIDETGTLRQKLFFTDTKGIFKKYQDHEGTNCKVIMSESVPVKDHQGEQHRIASITRELMLFVQEHKPSFVGIEDVPRMSFQKVITHQIQLSFLSQMIRYALNTGETMTNLGRIQTIQRPYRLYTPGQIKKFATGAGNAKKPEMVSAYGHEAGLDKRQIKAMYGNRADGVADAYWIAQLLRTEILVRNGQDWAISSLSPERQEVFGVGAKKKGNAEERLVDQPFINIMERRQ